MACATNARVSAEVRILLGHTRRTLIEGPVANSSPGLQVTNDFTTYNEQNIEQSSCRESS